MADLRQVGAQIVVEGSDQASQNWDKATAAETRNTEAVVKSAQTYGDAMRIQDAYFEKFPIQIGQTHQLAEAAGELDSAWKRAFMSFKDVGDSPQAALRSIEIEFERGAEAAEVFKSNQDLLFEKMTELAGAGKTWNEIQTEMNELAGKNAVSHERISNSAVQSSRAFFALTLASFGLMSISQELKKSFGDDLPPAFEKVTSAVQQIASFGSAGAFIGGGPGALIGGIVGGIVALTTALGTADPSLQRLNQQLDNLARKDELVNSLRDITGWTKEEAQAMLELAKTSPEVAAALEKVADTSAPMNELQLAIRGIGVEWDKLHQVITKDPELLAGAIAGPVGAGFIAAMRQLGIDGSDALITGLKATHPELLVILQAFRGLADEGKAAAEQDKVLADSMLAVDVAGAKAAEGTAKLVEGLHNLGVGDLNTQLAETANVSEEVAKSFLKFAGTHRDVAVEAEQLAAKIRDEKEEIARLQEIMSQPGATAADLGVGALRLQALTGQLKENEGALHDLVLANQAAEDSTDKLAKAQERLSDAFAEAGFRTAQLAQRTANQYAAAQQQFNNAVADASEQRANAVFNAEQTLANRMTDLWTTLSDKIVDINQTLRDKIADAQQQLSNRLFDIETERQNRISDISQQLSDKISSIQQDLANKLADLDHKRTLDVQQANDKIQDAARDLSRKLYEIERERVQAIEALAYDTHNRLMDARTDHDRERVLRDAQFQQGQIDQKANDARSDAQRDFADKVRQAERDKQLAKDTYDYDVMLAKQLAAQKIAEAQHAAAIQIAQAERQAQQQILIAQRQAAQQQAIAEREAQQQLALAQRRYAEELAQAQRAYQQQVEAARRAEAQRNADAQRSLEQRNAAIAQQAELERQQIQHTLETAIRAFQRQIAEIANLKAAVMSLIQAYLMLHGVIESIAKIGAAVTTNLFGGWIDKLSSFGGLFNAPPPTSSTVPTVPIIPKLLGGSIITPPKTELSTSNSSMTFIINDATDPKRVAEAVRREIANAAWR